MLSVLDVRAAQHYSEGKGVVVAVIDTGVDANNVDLRGNVLRGTDLTSGLPRGSGRSDANGHGTSMASLIGGHGHGQDNQDGVLGIAPSVTILPIRDSRSNAGFINHADEAVEWAAKHGAKVICMAFGGPQSNSQVAAAVLAAYDANIVLVAAAGNVPEGARTVQFPAAYAGVTAIGGTDRNGDHSKDSVTGGLITLVAPSDDIVSSDAGGGYITSSGTSNSTAIVAGAAALVRSRFPNLTAGEVVNRLTATAIDKGPPGRDDEYGYGLINLVGALTANVPAAGSTTPSPSAASPTSKAPTAQHNPTPTAITPPSRNNGATVVWIVAVVIVLLAVVGAWVLVRRRRPG
jgi:type VII secretion-associated serine protease mycosin